MEKTPFKMTAKEADAILARIKKDRKNTLAFYVKKVEKPVKITRAQLAEKLMGMFGPECTDLLKKNTPVGKVIEALNDDLKSQTVDFEFSRTMFDKVYGSWKASQPTVSENKGKPEEQNPEKNETEKDRQDALEQERLDRQDALERERLEKVEKERIEKAEAERLEQEKLKNDRLEKERLDALEQERLEKEQAEKAEAERLEQEKLEKDRLEKAESERLEKVRLEKEQAEKAEADKLEQVKLENARLEKGRLDALEQERLEKDRLEKAEAERLEKERLENAAERNGVLVGPLDLTSDEKKLLKDAALQDPDRTTFNQAKVLNEQIVNVEKRFTDPEERNKASRGLREKLFTLLMTKYPHVVTRRV